MSSGLWGKVATAQVVGLTVGVCRHGGKVMGWLDKAVVGEGGQTEALNGEVSVAVDRAVCKAEDPASESIIESRVEVGAYP